MARVVALVPDLMFGSKLHAALSARGHQVTLVPNVQAAADAAGRADALVADLASGTVDGAALIAALPAPALRTLACYSHVDAAARVAAEEAGFDLVVPRSRLHREGPELLERLLASPGPQPPEDPQPPA